MNWKKYSWILIWAGVSVLFALIIHIAFHFPAPCEQLSAVWSAGNILTYFSTISLGLLALWQNQKMYLEKKKDEEKSIAFGRYVLFDFDNLKATFNENSKQHKEEAVLINTGFNGDKAIWTGTFPFEKFDFNTLHITIKIKNIGDYPATHIRIEDKKHKPISNCNILHSVDDKNDKKYIINGDSGILIINVDLNELNRTGEIAYFLSFENPFGSQYRQKIIVRKTMFMIQIDTQITLEVL